jgi:VanZ family protein
MQVALLRRVDPWLPPLMLMAVIFALSAQPHLNSGLGLADTILRKAVHFGEFAMLAFLWWRVFVGRLTPGQAALAAFLVTAAYAATDELHQGYVSGRHASPVDWAIDSAGAGLAALRLRKGLRLPGARCSPSR